MTDFFYNLFADCVQLFYIISLICKLFVNKESLYKELEAEIWLLIENINLKILLTEILYTYNTINRTKWVAMKNIFVV